MYIIYKTTNLINGKYYIGVHAQKSKTSHKEYLGSGQLLKSAIKKYGRQNFKRETLFTYSTLQEALAKEKEIVSEDFILNDSNYNIAIGGGIPPSSKLWWTAEHSKKASDRLKNNKYRAGIIESLEAKQKRIEAIRASSKTGRYVRSEEIKEKSRTRSRKLFLTHNPMNNAESRYKVSLSKIGRKKMINDQGLQKYVKPVDFDLYLSNNFTFVG